MKGPSWRKGFRYRCGFDPASRVHAFCSVASFASHHAGCGCAARAKGNSRMPTLIRRIDSPSALGLRAQLPFYKGMLGRLEGVKNSKDARSWSRFCYTGSTPAEPYRTTRGSKWPDCRFFHTFLRFRLGFSTLRKSNATSEPRQFS